MSINYSVANYSGRQPNNSAYIKTFTGGNQIQNWISSLYYDSTKGTNVDVITTYTPGANVYIQGDLYVDGSIYNPSDINLKEDIKDIELDDEVFMLMRPKQFKMKYGSDNRIHYGFIAQEFENIIPELIHTKPDDKMNNLKAVNYVELVPILVNKIQKMQGEIDNLKADMDELKSIIINTKTI